MTDMNAQNNGRVPGAFAADIATDLASGRAVDLAEVYALDAVDDAERAAIEHYLAAAPAAERARLQRTRAPGPGNAGRQLHRGGGTAGRPL